MRRFTVSYGKKKDIEGIQYSDGNINLNDSWVPGDFDNIAQLEKVLSQEGTKHACKIKITWLDNEAAK